VLSPAETVAKVTIKYFNISLQKKAPQGSMKLLTHSSPREPNVFQRKFIKVLD
jgi:hypothetical protein